MLGKRKSRSGLPARAGKAGPGAGGISYPVLGGMFGFGGGEHRC